MLGSISPIRAATMAAALATCIGNNFGAAISMLKQELSDTEKITLAQAKDLAVKVPILFINKGRRAPHF